MSRRKKNAPKGYYVARVVNPGNRVIFLPAHPARVGNPCQDDTVAFVRSMSAKDRKTVAGFFQVDPRSANEIAHQLRNYARERASAGAPTTASALAKEIAQRGWKLVDGVPHLKSRTGNPKVRYTFVPVDYDGDGSYDESVVVRGGSRDEAIRAVANDVPADAWLDVGRTRTMPTKHEVIREGGRISSRVRELARRIARGES